MPFDQAQTDRALRLSVREGSAWALMVGLAETYFVADAVRLGASTLQLALTITLPLAVAGAGPALALSLLRTLDRRPVAVAAALVQAAILSTLAALDGTGRNAPAILIGMICLYQTAGLAAGTAWSSWYGDLVPAELRGRYFARRNRFIYAATCLGLVAGGTLLHALEPRGTPAAGGGGTGHAVILALAVVCRLASAYLLYLSPEPAFQGIAGRRHTAEFFRTSSGRPAVKLLGAAAAFYFAAYLASPYFGPFMLETLRFTYVQYMVASVWVVVVKALSTVMWGRTVDRWGPGRVFRIGLLLVAAVPLPWIVANDLTLVLVGQGLSGLAWCAYELGFFTSMLGATTPAIRPAVFAVQSMVMGWVQLGAAVAGAALVNDAGVSFRALFAGSAGARFVVALVVVLWVRRALVLAPVRYASLSLRALGVRPTGGLSNRPVFDASGDDREIARER